MPEMDLNGSFSKFKTSTNKLISSLNYYQLIFWCPVTPICTYWGLAGLEQDLKRNKV